MNIHTLTYLGRKPSNFANIHFGECCTSVCTVPGLLLLLLLLLLNPLGFLPLTLLLCWTHSPSVPMGFSPLPLRRRRRRGFCERASGDTSPPLCKNFTRYPSSSSGSSKRGAAGTSATTTAAAVIVRAWERRERETVFSGGGIFWGRQCSAALFFERDFSAAQGGKKAYTVHMNRLSVSIIIVLYLWELTPPLPPASYYSTCMCETPVSASLFIVVGFGDPPSLSVSPTCEKRLIVVVLWRWVMGKRNFLFVSSHFSPQSREAKI